LKGIPGGKKGSSGGSPEGNKITARQNPDPGCVENRPVWPKRKPKKKRKLMGKKKEGRGSWDEKPCIRVERPRLKSSLCRSGDPGLSDKKRKGGSPENQGKKDDQMTAYLKGTRLPGPKSHGRGDLLGVHEGGKGVKVGKKTNVPVHTNCLNYDTLGNAVGEDYSKEYSPRKHPAFHPGVISRLRSKKKKKKEKGGGGTIKGGSGRKKRRDHFFDGARLKQTIRKT